MPLTPVEGSDALVTCQAVDDLASGGDVTI
jgi:hypothetical protein